MLYIVFSLTKTKQLLSYMYFFIVYIICIILVHNILNSYSRRSAPSPCRAGAAETAAALRCMSILCIRICYSANLPTNIVGFGGLDSSIILIQRGGILRSIGDFPESLRQAMLVGTMLVGRLGVYACVICVYVHRYTCISLSLP